MGGKSSSSSSGFFSSCCCCFFPNSTASSRTTRHSCRRGTGSTEAEQQLTREHGGAGSTRHREQQPSALTGSGQHGDAVVELGVVDDAGSTYWVRAATNKYGGGEGRGRRQCGWSVRRGGCGSHDDTEAGATHDGGARRRPAEGATARRRVFRLGRGRRGLGGEYLTVGPVDLQADLGAWAGVGL